MTIDACIDNALAGGEISKAEADRLKGLYRSFVRDRAKHGGAVLPLEARTMLAALLKAEKGHKRMQAALAIKNLRDLDADLANFRRPNGAGDVADAALAKLEHFGTAPFSSVEGRAKAIVGQAHGRMEELLHQFRRSAFLGDNLSIGPLRFSFRHNQARLGNVVKEAFGEDSGDAAAKGLAKAWTETAEWLRRRFNAAGGAIGKLENWGLPQFHDARALRKIGREAWKARIAPLLDVSRMRHPLTEAPVGDDELDELLDHVWHSVAMEGWNGRQPARRAFGAGALASQKAEHRVLVFEDAASWLAYQKDFGQGDPFAAMMQHINVMARDVAALEILGPNPGGTVEWLKQAILREAAKAAAGDATARFAGKTGEAALSRGRSRARRLDVMWSAMRGELETPVNSFWADTLAATRNWITGSVLGSASISALGDVGTQVVARRFTGIPAYGVVSEIAKGFATAPRREAVRAGLILDQAQHTFHRQARYIGTLSGPEWSAWLTDRVLTWSALTPWTQAGQHAFGLAFQGEVAQRASQRFGDLPVALRLTFERWGLSASDWDVMRAAALHEPKAGATFLRPREIAEIDERLAERYLEMILSETQYAVPTGSIAARTTLVSTEQPGTFWGEMRRSFAQFKSFGAVFAILNGQRIALQLQGDRAMKARGAAYAGSLLISTTLFGALSLQLKQISAGRDPRDMTSLDFVGAALLQGGGLGIYGDFLFSDVNRYGGGFPTTIAGPTIEHVWDAWTLTAGNLMELAQGKDTKAGRELVKFLRGNTPGGTLWYARLGYERVLLDQLQWLADPAANDSFKAKQKWWRDETGQEFYWRPGEIAPDRAPDFSAAIGG